ncbi:MAG: DSBA-like thioredoxin protein [Candidatus Peribacteria bacterium]|nr:DSBA-like thioredoxin protein [Candidatus Peribacteria bacterium]
MSDSLHPSNPWPAISAGLGGVIIGFIIGTTGVLSPVAPVGVAVVANNAPAAPANVPAAPVAAPAVQPIPSVDVATDRIRGPKNAKVTIVEYSDIQCPYCKRHHPTMLKLMELYPNDVNWVYRHFPLQSIHPFAQKAAEATECLVEQKKDKFWDYLDAIIALDPMSEDSYLTVAKTFGVNEAKFKDCVTSGKYAQKVADQQNGGVSAGVQGTPANFIIDNATKKSVSIDGAAPLSSFQSAIDGILKS